MLHLAIGPLGKRKLHLKGHAVSFMVNFTIFLSIHRPYRHVPGPVHCTLVPALIAGSPMVPRVVVCFVLSTCFFPSSTCSYISPPSFILSIQIFIPWKQYHIPTHNRQSRSVQRKGAVSDRLSGKLASLKFRSYRVASKHLTHPDRKSLII